MTTWTQSAQTLVRLSTNLRVARLGLVLMGSLFATIASADGLDIDVLSQTPSNVVARSEPSIAYSVRTTNFDAGGDSTTIGVGINVYVGGSRVRADSGEFSVAGNGCIVDASFPASWACFNLGEGNQQTYTFTWLQPEPGQNTVEYRGFCQVIPVPAQGFTPCSTVINDSVSTIVANANPTASIVSPAGSSISISRGGAVFFAGNGSDPDGDSPLSYFWNFDGGAANTSAEDPDNVTFNSVGVYQVSFQVTDPYGGTGTDEVTVTVNSICGDGILDFDEQCDDGNTDFGDCCSAKCAFETLGSTCEDDGNVCTTEVCNGAGTCIHSNNSASCSDGAFCNGADTCSGGTCALHAGDPCAGADSDGNCSESCNEGANACTAPDPNGSFCNDGAFCNGADTCASGTCSSHAGDPCLGPDGDADCSESCNENTDGCTAPDPDQSVCSDGLFCNGSDTCADGVCVIHSGDPCLGPDGDADCSESCNENADGCTAPDPDASVCNDGAFCNGSDLCAAGVCSIHEGDPCGGPDGDGDCSESCDEGADDCAGPDPDASACTDGFFCNGADTCSGGTCSEHVGDPCSGADGDANCSESCDENASDCSAPDPNKSLCDDGTFCNGADSCAGGECTSHSGDPCDGPDGDGNCAESCDEAEGDCAAPDVNASVCDDGLFCTGDDACSGGQCVVHAGNPCFGPDGDADCSETCDEGKDNCNGLDPRGSICDSGDECSIGATCDLVGQCSAGQLPIPVPDSCPVVDLSIVFDDPVVDVEIEGGLAFVAALGAGLRIVDISDPEELVEVASYDPALCVGIVEPFRVLDVEIGAEQLFLSAGSCGVYVFDLASALSINNSSDPVVIFSGDQALSVHVPRGGQAPSFFALASDHAAGLVAIDVAGDPVLTDAIGGDKDEGFGRVLDSKNASSRIIAATDLGLQQLSLSPTGQFVALGGYESQTTIADEQSSQGVEVVSDKDLLIAYLTRFGSGIEVLDVTDPNSVALLKTLPSGDAVHGVTLAGDFGFIADGFAGVPIISIVNPAKPAAGVVEPFESPGETWDVEVDAERGLAVIGYGEAPFADLGGLRVVELELLNVPPARVIEPFATGFAFLSIPEQTVEAPTGQDPTTLQDLYDILDTNGKIIATGTGPLTKSVDIVQEDGNPVLTIRTKAGAVNVERGGTIALLDFPFTTATTGIPTDDPNGITPLDLSNLVVRFRLRENVLVTNANELFARSEEAPLQTRAADDAGLSARCSGVDIEGNEQVGSTQSVSEGDGELVCEGADLTENVGGASTWDLSRLVMMRLELLDQASEDGETEAERSVSLLSFEIVPEPRSALYGAGALLCLAVLRRRRSRGRSPIYVNRAGF